MERNWLDKLQACKDFDDIQKAELRGRLLALQCAGTDPNVTMMGDDEDIRQCLDVLLHAPIRPKLTLREVMSYPLPEIEPPSAAWEPSSTTQPTLPKTFNIVLSWPEFRKGSQELYSSLNNIERLYTAPTYDIVDGMPDGYPRHKLEVVELLTRMLKSVSTAAKVLGTPVKCSGGGASRSLSFTHLVLRSVDADGILAEDPSSRVLMTTKVKGEWDFELKRGDRLEDRLHNTKSIEGIVRTVQEAYGDAVFDEAPLLVITNYRVTVFLKRSPDGKDKRLWASEPIWLDDTSPPPRVSWLYGLQLAHELQGWKARLPRADVPASRKRKLIAEEPANDTSNDSRRMIPRKTNVSSSRQASHPSYEGHEMELPPSAALQLANDLTDLRSEETVLLSELEFGGLINKGSYANTFKGVHKGRSVAIKIFNTDKPGAIAAYASEKHAYLQLKALQGEAIPYLWRSGLLAHTSAPVIVTSLEGVALDEDLPVPKDLHWPMRRALQALHAAGACHGNLRLSNFVVEGRKVRLVGLGQTSVHATRKQRDAERCQLKAMLA